jgi:hypothetical protein
LDGARRVGRGWLILAAFLGGCVLLLLAAPASPAQAATGDGSHVAQPQECRDANTVPRIVADANTFGFWLCQGFDNLSPGSYLATAADVAKAGGVVGSWSNRMTPDGLYAFPTLDLSGSTSAPLPDGMTAYPDTGAGYPGDAPASTTPPATSPPPSSPSPDPTTTTSAGATPLATATPAPTDTASPAPSGSTASAADAHSVAVAAWAVFGLLGVLGCFGLFLGALHVVGRMLA